MPIFLISIASWIWSKVGKYLVMAGVAAAAIGGFALEMEQRGKRKAEAKQAAANAKTIATTRSADASVSQMSDTEVDAEIKKWEPKN